MQDVILRPFSRRAEGDVGRTVYGLAMWRKSKHKSSVLHKSSIEELNLNLALQPPYCQTDVSGCGFHIKSAFALLIFPSLKVKSNVPPIFPSGNSPVNSTSMCALLSERMSILISRDCVL